MNINNKSIEQTDKSLPTSDTMNLDEFNTIMYIGLSQVWSEQGSDLDEAFEAIEESIEK